MAVGVAAAVVILMLAVTGVILTYEAQLNQWALRDYRADPPSPGVAPLGLDDLIARVSGGTSAVLVTSATLHRDPLEPAVVGLDDGATVYVDRFTGERLGNGDTRTRRFLQNVMYWHRWFALDGEHRIIGRTVVAIANLGFLFLLVSGIYLWWPSTRSRAAWKHGLWFRPGLRGRARDYNWHKVIGFWSAVPLVVIVFSGATISYQWAADLVHRLAGDTPPFQQSPRPQSDAWETPSVTPDPATPFVELQALAAKAGAETPGWRTLTIDLPESIHDPVVVTVDRGTGRQPSKREDLLFDRATGELVGRAGYPTFTRGFKIRRWLRFAHTGEVYGVVGQTIAGVVSLAVAVLVWTGLAMSWRRFFGRAGPPA
ncbi:MAG: PepSY-associated TM helix domain-containing protein [Acidobacteria bacterium]|nr:PepSY-associated TM helix domain-containing protein [Acidobacteriota bacterium]